jgi:periplasmic protein CpxP/Spy
MNTLRGETVALLAAAMVFGTVLGAPVHAQPEGHSGERERPSGMGMMDRGQDMGMMQRGPMMDEQGMMHGEESMAMMSGMRQMHRIMHELDLTEAQRAEFRALRHAHREAQFERMARMMNEREDMHALMAAEQPDPDEVREQHGRMAEIRGEMLAEQVRFRNSVMDLLTEDQRQQLQMEQSASHSSEPADQAGHDAHH